MKFILAHQETPGKYDLKNGFGKYYFSSMYTKSISDVAGQKRWGKIDFSFELRPKIIFACDKQMKTPELCFLHYDGLCLAWSVGWLALWYWFHHVYLNRIVKNSISRLCLFWTRSTRPV